MNLDDKENFIKLLTAMAEVFEKEMSDIKIEYYFAALQEFDFVDVKRAANILGKTWKAWIFPRPADFREFILPNLDDASLLALEKFEKAALDPYKSVIFDDPVIHAVVDAFGGWVTACNMMDLEDWKFKRQEFVKLYKVLAKNMKGRHVPLKLVGIHETNNAGKYPLHENPLMIIGDRNKAMAWSGKAQKQLMN